MLVIESAEGSFEIGAYTVLFAGILFGDLDRKGHGFPRHTVQGRCGNDVARVLLKRFARLILVKRKAANELSWIETDVLKWIQNPRKHNA